MTDTDFEVGDTLENTSPMALAKKVRVTDKTKFYFRADVLEGDNTKNPITVYRAGWFLYRKAAPQRYRNGVPKV